MSHLTAATFTKMLLGDTETEEKGLPFGAREVMKHMEAFFRQQPQYIDAVGLLNEQVLSHPEIAANGEPYRVIFKGADSAETIRGIVGQFVRDMSRSDTHISCWRDPQISYNDVDNSATMLVKFRVDVGVD